MSSVDELTSFPVTLSAEFLGKYKDTKPLSPLGEFVYYRTYSRFKPELGRRESWIETCKRAAEFSVSLQYKHMDRIGLKIDQDALTKEAEELFDSMYNTKQFVSGRSLWIGGAPNNVGERYALANFNCSFLNINSWKDLGDLFYLLMVGTGVGFKCTPGMARRLAPIRNDVEFIHAEYNPVEKERRLEHSKFIDFEEKGGSKLYVGDSKEGWVEALNILFEVLTDPAYEHVKSIKFSYDSVRPAKEPLKTFGGTASGPEPLREMFEGIDKVIKNQMDPSLDPLESLQGPYVKVRPIHILDIGNLVGNNVVVGGVRRTAEIFLFGENDLECAFAKYGINGLWTQDQVDKHVALGNKLDEKPSWWDSLAKVGAQRTGLDHRRMSNNSIAYKKKPNKKHLDIIFDLMQMEGEPGFVNLEYAAKRRPNAEGTNPCGEILLDSYGVCNLTTVNMMAFVENGKLDYQGLLAAQRRSARAGTRMTLIDLEIPAWDATQKRDRLIGTSLTGIQDAFGELGLDMNARNALLKALQKEANDEATKYAMELRIPRPLLVTTIKPEGTLSLVAGGVSPGVHAAHAPYYIRRIRVNAGDPLARVAKELEWPINPDVGTAGDTFEAKMANARTIVIDFPIKSNSRVFKEDLTIEDQFNMYVDFQENYTDHNTSITMTVRPEEWEQASELTWKNWDNFGGVAFLPYDGGSYELAPYEEITEDQYNELSSKFKSFNPDLLLKYEYIESELLDADCEGGACPIR